MTLADQVEAAFLEQPQADRPVTHRFGPGMYGEFTPVTVSSVTYGPLERERLKVEKAERLLETLPQVDCPVTHHFAPGVYMREMFIPAGVMLTGAVHKTEHLTMLVKGRLLLVNGGGGSEVVAPATLLSLAGIKRAGYAMEDSIVMTIHATNETDPDKLVSELTESTASELLGGAENRQLAVSGPQPERLS